MTMGWKTIDSEIWKKILIKGTPLLVSSYGNFKRMRKNGEWKNISTNRKPNAYVTICLKIEGKHKTFIAHPLVALAFIGEKPNGLIVNHKDGVKNNNNINNLEYVTYSENILHAIKIGLFKNHSEFHPAATLSNERVLAIIEDLKIIKVSAVAKKYNLSVQTIYKIRNGEIWRHVSHKKKWVPNMGRRFSKIVMLDKAGAIIKKFNSIKEASNNERINKNNISSACQGKRLSAGGFKWAYQEELQ